MTDPMTRIADALELIALAQSRDSDGYASDMLRGRVLAQYTVPTGPVPVLPTTDTRALCSFGCGRVATETANGEPVCGDANACVDMKREVAPPPDDDPEWRDVPAERAAWNTVRQGDRFFTARGYDKWTTAVVRFADVEQDYDTQWSEIWIKRKPAPVASEPQTVDVMGSELRVGDVVVAVELEFGARLNHDGFPAIVARLTDGEVVYTDNDRTDLGCVHRVRLPRPDAEPSASGEGIARADRLCITVSYGAGSYTWTARNEGEARTIEAAINAAHAHATRELRARCERAERERDEVRAALFSCATLRDEYERERAAAIARAEAAERERDEALTEFNGVADERDRAKFERAAAYADRDAAIARADAAERVVEAAINVVAAWRMPGTPLTAVCIALSNALDAARKDGAK